jgi:inner membrane protein
VPTVVTHAFVGAALSTLGPRARRGARLGAAAAALSALPDLDVVAFSLGIPYAHPLGHRGFSHSLLFAALAGLAAGLLLFRRRRLRSVSWWQVVLLLALVTASHGFLDAFTDGGRGVGFLIPWSNQRFFFPWRPLAVSPIGVSGLTGARMTRVLGDELLWVWAPTVVLAAAWRLHRRGSR